MLNHRIQKSIVEFSKNCSSGFHAPHFLEASLSFTKNIFGLKNAEGVLAVYEEKKAYYTIYNEGRNQIGILKNFDLLEVATEWNVLKNIQYLESIDSFDTLTPAQNLCRKFTMDPTHIELFSQNFRKTPSVFIPIHDSSGVLQGFIHAFESADALIAKPDQIREPLVLQLLKVIIENQLKESLLLGKIEEKNYFITHLNHSLQQLENKLSSQKRNQEKMIAQSREIGMSDVATGVLHNVGNVLNSINVSSSVIAKDISKLKIETLQKVVSLLKTNLGSLDIYLKDDEIGKSLLDLLSKIAQDFSEKKIAVTEEIKTLTGHIQHVNSVISTQQMHAKSTRALESCSLIAVIEDALLMGIPRHETDIQIEPDFEPMPEVWINRHKVLQILVNLISNARNSLIDAGRSQKKLKVALCRTGKNQVRISVIDNGVGIPFQNMQAIFTQGFSTRPNGHGFGLHTSSTDAQELGGKLWCESNGPNTGAAFHLDLPIQLEQS